MHRQYTVHIPSYVFDFLAFIPYTLTECASAADMLAAEFPVVAAPFQPTTGVLASEVPHYHTVCTSLLSAPDAVE